MTTWDEKKYRKIIILFIWKNRWDLKIKNEWDELRKDEDLRKKKNQLQIPCTLLEENLRAKENKVLWWENEKKKEWRRKDDNLQKNICTF